MTFAIQVIEFISSLYLYTKGKFLSSKIERNVLQSFKRIIQYFKPRTAKVKVQNLINAFAKFCAVSLD